MHQRVRCPECHHWTDALLVWAAGDCCPNCNAPITGFNRAVEENEDERMLRPPSRMLRPGVSRLSQRP
jgi:hypothetical protein